MTKSNEEWARWLNDALARRGWKAADLVRASGVKDNGRPVLAADVVSGYLNKGARPKPEFILVLADALGVEDMTIARASGLLREPAPSPEPARSFAEIEADMARERATREARAVNVAGLDAEDIQALNAMANRLRAAKKIDADAGAELIRQTEQLSESTLERREQLRKQRPTPRQGRKREVR